MGFFHTEVEFNIDVARNPQVEGVTRAVHSYGGTAYQDPANQDPLSQNSENTALRN